MNTFYVRHRGEIRGPIDVEKLRSLAAAGTLKRFHELAPSAEGPWTRADKLLPSLPFTSHAANEAAPAEGVSAAAPAPALHDAFISHSSKDKLSADAVCSSLESRGIRCWVAPRDIAPGANWGEAIIDGLSHSRVVILILSQHANVSPQVMREVERAVSKGIPIVPLRIEDVPLSKSMEYFLSSAHWMDAFTPPLRKHLDGLVQRVAAMISAEAAVAPRPVPAGPAPAVGRSVTGRATILGGLLLGALVLGVATWLPVSRRHAVPPVEDVTARKPAPQAADSTGAGTAPARPSWLGITPTVLPACVAEHLGANAGAIGVADVVADGPAAQAGVRQDDVLMTFDGQPVPDAKAFEGLKIPELPADGTHTLKVLRASRPVELTVKLQPRPPAAGEEAGHDRMMFETRHLRGVGLVKGLQLQGDFLAWRGSDGDPNLVIFNVASEAVPVPLLYGRRVSAAALLPGGRQIVLAGPEDELSLCDTATGEVVRHFETTPGTSFRRCQVSRQGDVVATLSDDKAKAVLETWDVATGTRRSKWNLSDIAGRSEFGGGLSISGDYAELGPFSPSGRYVSIGRVHISVWDVTTGKPAWWWKPEARTTSWAFSPSWRACAVASDKGVIEIVSPATNGVEQRLRGHVGGGGVWSGAQCIVWHGEKLLASASNGDRTARIWRLPDGKQIWEYRIEESPNKAFFFGPEAIVFDPVKPRAWTGVNRVREFEIPCCEAGAWAVAEPDTEAMDFAALAPPAARAGQTKASSGRDGGFVPQTSTTATYGDGRRREFFTFADGSKAKLDFPPGRSRPSATLVAADGKPFTGDAGLTLGVAEGKVRVVDVDVDGAASRAGIAPGDMVVAIAEAAAEDFVPFPPEETVSAEATRLRMLAGREGSKARLKIERAGADPARIDVVELTRSGKSPEFTIREKRFVNGMDRSVEFSDGSRLEVVSRPGGADERHVVIDQGGQRLAANLGMACTADYTGLVVATVTEDGPAAKAGIRRGDHVVAVAETEGGRFVPCDWTDAESARWSWGRLSHGAPGSKARLRLRRGAGDAAAQPELVTVAREVPRPVTPRAKAARADWTNGLGMPFILVKPGKFYMGAAGWLAQDDAPVHYVRISRPFLISAFEVTQADYAAIDPEHVSAFSVMGKERLAIFRAYHDGTLQDLDTSHLPVESVTWGEAAKFCEGLGERERVRYRLPTEAEWEYACRAAGASRWDKDVPFDATIRQAAVCGVSGISSSPLAVGGRTPNDLGIYDMLGNVAEWCVDFKDAGEPGARVDPRGPAEGLKRVARGGAYDSQFGALYQRAAFVPDERLGTLGFRIVISLDGDVGTDETLRKLVAAHAPSRPDLTIIPTRPAIVELPVRSAAEEGKAIEQLSADMLAHPGEAVRRVEDAIPTFQRSFLRCISKVVEIKPAAAKAVVLYDEGARKDAAGEHDLALRCYEQCMESDPLLGWAGNNIAWELATAMPEERRDADVAVRYAIAACQASGWRNWGHMDTLAAALAAAGEHQLAIQIAEAVLPHVPEDDREEFLHSLELYRAGKSYAPLPK